MKVDASGAECPAGFRASGIACGLKPSGRPDLALIVADQPATAAAMFTRNQVRAAPLVISQEHLRETGGRIRALLINSGCANAATGAEGLKRARRTVDALAKLLPCDEREVLVNSTGVIGVQLPDDKIVEGLQGLLKQASPDGLNSAMDAIMTTDTRPKMAQLRDASGGGGVHVAGIAKGAGMIHPNMATMIAVILTDAAVEPGELDAMLRRAADKSFHRISIDGDTSTNDAVFALASGQIHGVDKNQLEQAITAVARELAIMIVRDGEGAKKLIHVSVREARSASDALQIAQTVASSMLVRTAVAGGDPNWGRILAAIGRSGVDINIQAIRVSANGIALFANGKPAESPLPQREVAFRDRTVAIEIALGLGDAADEFHTCDLTEGYIEVNAHYTT